MGFGCILIRGKIIGVSQVLQPLFKILSLEYSFILVNDIFFCPHHIILIVTSAVLTNLCIFSTVPWQPDISFLLMKDSIKVFCW